MDKWNELKNTMAVMTEYVYNGFMFPTHTMHKFMRIREWILEDDEFESPYCPTCGSCGVDGCCPPTTCKYGVDYINDLRKELAATRKALAVYIEKSGYKVTEDIIDQEIEYYGKS